MDLALMRQGVLPAAVLFAALGVFLAPPVLASDDRTPPSIEWDDTISKFQADADKFIGQRITFSCPYRAPGSDDEPLYGTSIYPSEAPLCLAAKHAGLITDEGGTATVQLNPGAERYEGTAAHGVTSADLPASERSVVFVTGATEASANATRAPHLPRLKWDQRFTHTGLANRDLIGQRFAFVCPPAPAPLPVGRVVGTDTYAFATPLCLAAMHAGVVTQQGGPITVLMGKGSMKLQGSTRNGVSSKSGSSGIRSLTFVDGGTS